MTPYSTSKTTSWLSQPLNSLGEAFPLQEVLHSPIKYSAAYYFLHHKLLDYCGLLCLPLFGSLLLSHPAIIEKNRRVTNIQSVTYCSSSSVFWLQLNNKTLSFPLFLACLHNNSGNMAVFQCSAVPFTQWSVHLSQRSTCCFLRELSPTTHTHTFRKMNATR